MKFMKVYIFTISVVAIIQGTSSFGYPTKYSNDDYVTAVVLDDVKGLNLIIEDARQS